MLDRHHWRIGGTRVYWHLALALGLCYQDLAIWIGTSPLDLRGKKWKEAQVA